MVNEVILDNLERKKKVVMRNRAPKTRVYLTGGLGNQLFQVAAAMTRDAGLIGIESILGSPRTNQMGLPDVYDFEFPTKLVLQQSNSSSSFVFFVKKVTGYVLRTGLNPQGIEKTAAHKNLVSFTSSLILSVYFRHPIRVIQATDNGFCVLPESKGQEILIGYFQSYKWADYSDVQEVLKSIELKNPSDVLLDFLCHLEGKKSLMVHLRLGDYKNENGFGIPEKIYIEDSLKAQFSYMNYDVIALFSNEPTEAIEYIPIEYRSKTIVVSEFDGRAAETLEAMRHMHGYVIANSSLSWWGAFLCKHKNPFVVAPRPWFKGNPEPTDIIPPNWERIYAWSNFRNT